MTALRNAVIAVVFSFTTAFVHADVAQSTVVRLEIEQNHKQLRCLAKAIHHEARGEPELGQIAVAFSVINRVDSPKFPNDICSVVFQRAQYTGIDAAKYKKTTAVWAESERIAYLVAMQAVEDPTGGAKFYYNPKKVSPYWREYAVGDPINIGRHRFIYDVRNK